MSVNFRIRKQFGLIKVTECESTCFSYLSEISFAMPEQTTNTPSSSLSVESTASVASPDAHAHFQPSALDRLIPGFGLLRLGKWFSGALWLGVALIF